MPVYGTPQAGSNTTLGLNLTELIPGDGPYYLFNAETLTAPQASVAFAIGLGPNGQPGLVTFVISFATAPTAEVDIQGAHVDLDGSYVSLFQSVNTQNDTYADLGGFAFYRAKLVSQSAGGAVTVTAH